MALVDGRLEDLEELAQVMYGGSVPPTPCARPASVSADGGFRVELSAEGCE